MRGRPACDAPQPIALPDKIPDLELTLEEERELASFDWSILDTLEVKKPRRKPANAIERESAEKLRLIDEHVGLPDGLSNLVEGIRALMAKQWKTFILFTDHDDDHPEDRGWWSNIQWRKADLVEFFTMISGQYLDQVKELDQTMELDQVEEAVEQAMELDTTEIDEEFLSLLEVILALEEDGEEKGAVWIKEWERPGTKATLEVEELMCRIEEKDDESDEEDSAFDGEELELALPEPGEGPLFRAWSDELPVVGRSKPPTKPASSKRCSKPRHCVPSQVSQ